MDSTSRKFRQRFGHFNLSLLILAVAAAVLLLVPPTGAQDNIFTGTNSGATTIRIAVADFKPLAADAQSTAFKQTFDATFYADLANAGIFDIVSKSLLPSANPGSPAEMQVQSYATAPASAAFVTFGSLGVVNGKLVVNGYLYDAKNIQYPQVLAKQYSQDATDDSTRQVAHRFADEIIFRLGGGTPGIAETTIYYVKIAAGQKEIWAMDYDGANQRPITHLGSISISPRVSPDNSRLAFATMGKYGFQLKMYSMLLGRYVNFPAGTSSSASPAWAPNGNELAYAAAPDGQFNIWIADSNGALARKVTSLRGGSISPVYNPKTSAQIAFISAVTGLPQLYIMNTDGSGVQRYRVNTDGVS